VSNSEYNEFVASVKASGDTALLRTVLVDSLGWRSTMGFQEPYIEYYHAHPAYAAYPVVNVRFAAAQAYCSWLAERINARPGIHVICRLPTRDEWVMAGEGGQVLAPYPWGSRLTNEKGQYLCNYHHIGDERIHQDPGPKAYTIEDPAEAYFTVDRFIRSGEGRYATQINTDDMDEMSPVRSYWPSSNGLYNMSGNAAEMIDSAGVAVGGSWINTGYDVRLWSTMTYDVPRPWIGFRPLLEIIP
jgi:formylglycine-generating enzyme required for sulfatase activity